MMLWGAPSLHPTTVVAIRREGKIVLAADSKRIQGKGFGVEAVKVCKVQRSGNILFAFAGITNDGLSGFSTSKIALKGKAKTIQLRAAEFVETAKGPLLRAAQRAHREASEAEYRQYFGLNNTTILEAIFVSMENHAAAYQYIQFKKVEDALGNPIQIDTEIQSCPGNSCGKTQLVPMGYRDEATAKYGGMIAQGWGPDDDVPFARRWVEAEISAQPDEVGPPVAIVVMDDAGVHWIDKGECGENEKY